VEEEEMKKEVEEEEKKREEVEKDIEVKEEEKSDMNSDNKYKGRREKDEDSKERGPYKKNTVNKCFENSCELANDKTTLSEIFQEFPSMFDRHYKTLERIVYE
jgi:hypothetical protein